MSLRVTPLLLTLAACTGQQETSDADSSTGAAIPSGTCAEIVARPGRTTAPPSYFWACRSLCKPDKPAGDGDATESYESYDLLRFHNVEDCYDLRTALYDCFASLTCEDVYAHGDALEANVEGPCTAEYEALAPKIELCGI